MPKLFAENIFRLLYNSTHDILQARAVNDV